MVFGVWCSSAPTIRHSALFPPSTKTRQIAWNESRFTFQYGYSTPIAIRRTRLAKLWCIGTHPGSGGQDGGERWSVGIEFRVQLAGNRRQADFRRRIHEWHRKRRRVAPPTYADMLKQFDADGDEISRKEFPEDSACSAREATDVHNADVKMV